MTCTDLYGNYIVWKGTSPGFYVSAMKVLKTLWEKDKLLASSNLSFSHSVFHPFGKLSAIFNLKLSSKLFHFLRV